MPSPAAGSDGTRLVAAALGAMRGCATSALLVLLAGCAGSGGPARPTSPLYLDMTAEDVRLANATIQEALEHQVSASSREWRNTRNGHAGSVTPTSTYVSQRGLYCREFTETLTIGARSERYRQEACRDVDGRWKQAR